VEAAHQAMLRGETHYTPTAGIPDLRRAIANKLRDFNGIQADPASEILVTTGGVGGLGLALLALVDPGDDVIIPDPSWPNYQTQSLIPGGRVINLPLREEEGFKVRAEAVEALLTPRTRVLFINTPGNPTGAMLEREELLELGELARSEQFYIVLDEVYEHIVYDENRHFSLASDSRYFPWVVTVNSFSKTYAMTGWRLGYSAGPAEVIKAMTLMSEAYVSCAPSFCQYAGIAALTGSQEPVQEMVRNYANRRDLLCRGLEEIPGISALRPKGALYVFANISSTGLSSRQAAERLLREAGVCTVPGTGFGQGGEGYLRLCFAVSSQDLERALERMETFFRRLA